MTLVIYLKSLGYKCLKKNYYILAHQNDIICLTQMSNRHIFDDDLVEIDGLKE